MMPTTRTTQSTNKSEEKDPYEKRQQTLIHGFVHEQQEKLQPQLIPSVIVTLILEFYMHKIKANEHHQLICICGATMKKEREYYTWHRLPFLEFKCHVCRKWHFETGGIPSNVTIKRQLWHCNSQTEKSKNIHRIHIDLEAADIDLTEFCVCDECAQKCIEKHNKSHH